MTGPTEYGGQGFPQMVSACFHEMLMAASLSFRVYSGLTEGAVLALYKHGDEALRRDYLAKLVSGEWAGTMCLTEPQAGTDLALLRTRAEAQADGSYAISGSKIFISGGEQDLTENIVHLVLARLADAPAGVKGISLFLVPKFVANPDGSLGERNSLGCGAIEHKMGIKGASTCVMNFDGARGWLLGQANQGLACMFTMMNDARFQVGLQGLGIAERAFQGALGYARERLQSRALVGPQAPDKAADPIIVHPDVRRMLLTQKTLVEGCRMLAACCARQLDLEHGHPDADGRRAATRRAALLIPIVKAFLTDVGQEVASLGVQVYGGHGFIREWGMEQLMRDSRITQIYEGTNGIQALDLVRRKLLGDQGGELLALQGELAAASEALRACCAGAAGRAGAATPGGVAAAHRPGTRGLRPRSPGDRRHFRGLPPVQRLRIARGPLVASRCTSPGSAGRRLRRGRFLSGQAAQRRFLPAAHPAAGEHAPRSLARRRRLPDGPCPRSISRSDGRLAQGDRYASFQFRHYRADSLRGRLRHPPG